MQLGALAKSAEGEYFQVVGNFIERLNKWKIEAAVTKAMATEIFVAPSRALAKQSSLPVVTVKRRRVPVMS